MAAALKLLAGGSAQAYAAGFGVISLVLQIFIPFPRYAPLLALIPLVDPNAGFENECSKIIQQQRSRAADIQAQ